MFNETLALLFDAHQYFQENSGLAARLAPGPQQAVAGEMGRITMRLTAVMAWIMVRRAVTSGRIDEGKAARSYRLEAGDDICIADAGLAETLDAHFGYLCERSAELYQRIRRLDDLAYGVRH
ncbi:MAG: DUF1465 family protein [Alphaproteobacteria bacterium]